MKRCFVTICSGAHANYLQNEFKFEKSVQWNIKFGDFKYFGIMTKRLKNH